MQSEILAILNPAAGGGKCESRGIRAISALQKRGLPIQLQQTNSPGHGTEIAYNAYKNGYRYFIAIGGDGTHNEILNGLFPLAHQIGEKPRLGFLPFGTGNSFIREFIHDPRNYDEKQLLTAKDYDCDVIRLTHTEGELFFINLLALGFVAEVGLYRNQFFKRLGNLGYVLAVLIKTWNLRARQYHLKVDDEEATQELATFLSFNNSRYTAGNMLMAPAANINDGFLDVTHIKKMNRFSLIKTFPKIFSGTHVNTSFATTYKAKKIYFNLDEKIPVLIDGEIVSIKPTKIEILPNNITVRI